MLLWKPYLSFFLCTFTWNWSLLRKKPLIWRAQHSVAKPAASADSENSDSSVEEGEMMRAHYQKNHAHTRTIYRDRVDLATISRSQTSILIVLDGYLHAKCVQMLFTLQEINISPWCLAYLSRWFSKLPQVGYVSVPWRVVLPYLMLTSTGQKELESSQSGDTLDSYNHVLMTPRNTACKGHTATSSNSYGSFLKWWYPHFTPQVLIIFSRKNHGCWAPPF